MADSYTSLFFNFYILVLNSLTMKEPIVYLKGEFLPASRAAISISDLGVVMGATFTEMTRTFRHELFCGPEHIERLFDSMEYSSVVLPHSPSEVLEITREVVAHNQQFLNENQELAAVQFVTPGENLMYAGLGSGLTLEPTFCVHTFPLPFERWRALFRDGAHCAVPSTLHLPSESIDSRIKHRSRLHWWLAERELQKTAPGALPLLLDTQGYLTESAGANFLIVQDRTVFSPTSRNILNGISLQTTKKLAAEIGFKWIEKDLEIQDVFEADEAWLTTTPYCIAPCTRLNQTAIGGGKIGARFQEILAAWNQRVGLDIRAQIMHGENSF